MRFTTFVFLLFVCFDIVSIDAQENNDADRLNKLNAFARTFGYVRYFHPSDQAALVDWEAMACFGAEKALSSDQDQTTADLLRSIFEPIVVDLEFYEGSQKPLPQTKKVAASEIIAWQHNGVGISNQGLYRSARTNRTSKSPANASPFGNITQSVVPNELRGKEIRFRFQARIEAGKCRLQGWYRVDRDSDEMGLFENMGDRPITSNDWAEYELTGTVDDDAKNLTFGVMFMGRGSALVDNVRLEQKIDDQWKTVDIRNPDFELGETKIESWALRGNGYALKPTTDDVANGKQAVRISRRTAEQAGGIFDLVPELGEVVDAAVTDTLRVRMPLSLPVDAVYESDDDEATDKFIETVAETDFGKADQQTQCVCNVILLWNLFQHFYPYFEQVDSDWNAVLNDGLRKAIDTESREQTAEILQWMVAQLHDGHGMVFDTATMREMQLAPVNFAWVENQLVVTASDDDNFQVGDMVKKVGDQPAAEYLADREKLISGSPQWKRARSTQQLSRGKSNLAIELICDGKAVSTELKYEGRKSATVDKGEICRLLVDDGADEEDVWYIDLGRAEPKDVNDKMKKFAAAKGLVLDLRGYPRGTQYLFQHMTDEHMQSQKWQVPKQVHPDRIDMKEIETMSRWEMPPLKPRFTGKMVFITNASAISYAESCMSIVAHYKLGEIIGSPTAGANGNVNPFSLPGGFRVSWTGMRVMNHDDSQHHVRGVQPTIPIEQTFDGIRAGKDELLEKALEIITNQ